MTFNFIICYLHKISTPPLSFPPLLHNRQVLPVIWRNPGNKSIKDATKMIQIYTGNGKGKTTAALGVWL